MADELNKALTELQMVKLKRGIEKNASIWQGFKNAFTTSKVGETVGQAALTAAAAAGITAGGVGIQKGFTALRSKIEKPKLFKSMLESSPGLKKMDQKKVHLTFNTIYNMNREMAKDPLVAGSFVERSVAQADISDSAGVYVDPNTAKTMLESRQRSGEPILRSFTGAIQSGLEGKGIGAPDPVELERRKAEQRSEVALSELPRRTRSQAHLERFKHQLRELGSPSKLPTLK
jgi:hypothetical protein